MLRSHKVLCLVLMLCIGAPGLRVANAQAQAPTQTQTQPTGTDSGQGQAPAPKSTLPPELTAPIDK
ncbi:MAG TPA: hypothetical protein VF051_06140, partial [Hyphomicrobiaceae bacterium]